MAADPLDNVATAQTLDSYSRVPATSHSSNHEPGTGQFNADGSEVARGISSWQLNSSSAPPSSSAPQQTQQVAPLPPVDSGGGWLPSWVTAPVAAITEALTPRSAAAKRETQDLKPVYNSGSNDTSLYDHLADPCTRRKEAASQQPGHKGSQRNNQAHPSSGALAPPIPVAGDQEFYAEDQQVDFGSIDFDGPSNGRRKPDAFSKSGFNY